MRAYDVASRRLLPGPITDPRNPDEKMTGFPMTRTTSADGRWAYTLYSGGEENFVHALDLARGRAFCIDLHGLLPDELAAMKLAARNGHVDLLNQSGAVVRRIDASTFRVTEPPASKAPAAAPTPTHQAADETQSDSFPWGLAAAVAAVAGVALFVLRRRYAAGTDSAASRSTSSSSATVPWSPSPWRRSATVPSSASLSPTTSMYGTFCSSASRILRPTDSVRSSTSARMPAPRERGGGLARASMWRSAIGSDDRLHRREPDRQLARVVLDAGCR